MCSGSQASKRGADTEGEGAVASKKAKGPAGDASAAGEDESTALNSQEAEGDTQRAATEAAATDEGGPSAQENPEAPVELNAEAHAADVDDDDGLIGEDNDQVHNLVLAQFDKACPLLLRIANKLCSAIVRFSFATSTLKLALHRCRVK
jgi:hypothetical protein